uniref:Mu transposase C-terminal domain-containing protein n=1 Tax=Hassallia byssoidea TaxID=482630 RepID=UPI001F2E152C|nr:Mu transposase C-terminal domain-containing protein [Hassalia byssoidea]
MALSPDGTIFACGETDYTCKDQSIKVFDLNTGQRICTFKIFGHAVFADFIAISPNGKHLVWNTSGQITVGTHKVRDLPSNRKHYRAGKKYPSYTKISLPGARPEKMGQPCIKDPRYPTNNLEEGCPIFLRQFRPALDSGRRCANGFVSRSATCSVNHQKGCSFFSLFFHGTINTDFLSGFYGYLGSNIQERPEQAEEEACITLRELNLLIVRYIIDNYNQRIDARSGDQTRFQRWEAGLPALPSLINDRELDICLMKKTRRSIYKGGYVSFENIMYRGDYLPAYAGESVLLRYDPRDISTVFVYRQDSGKEVLLSQQNAIDLETEQISLEEAKAASRKIRSAGKQLSNKSILAEVQDRDTFIKQKKKTHKERKKEEQAQVHSVKPFQTKEPVETVEETPYAKTPTLLLGQV